MLLRKGLLSCVRLLIASGCILVVPGIFAQSAEIDPGELALRGGIAFGPPGMGSRAFVGGSTGLAISRYGMGLLDVSYLPLGQHTIQGWPDRASVTGSYMLDFGLDLHVRIPVKERLAPYAIIGAGLLWNAVHQQTNGPAGSVVKRGYDQWNGALHTGGGLRYYMGEKWGIRPEIKVIVSKQVYTSMSVGIFYVVPSNWP